MLGHTLLITLKSLLHCEWNTEADMLQASLILTSFEAILENFGRRMEYGNEQDIEMLICLQES